MKPIQQPEIIVKLEHERYYAQLHAEDNISLKANSHSLAAVLERLAYLVRQTENSRK